MSIDTRNSQTTKNIGKNVYNMNNMVFEAENRAKNSKEQVATMGNEMKMGENR